MAAGFQAGAKFYSTLSAWALFCELYRAAGCRDQPDEGAVACPGWLTDFLEHYLRSEAVLRQLTGSCVFITTSSFSQVTAAEDARMVSQVRDVSEPMLQTTATEQMTEEMEEQMHLYHAAMICRRAANKVKASPGDCSSVAASAVTALVPTQIDDFLHTYYYGELPASGTPRADEASRTQ